MSARKKLSFWWKLSVRVYSRRRLHLGVLSDQFLFRVSEDMWLFGRYRLENESRYFSYAADGMADGRLEILDRVVAAHDAEALRTYVENRWRHSGPLRSV